MENMDQNNVNVTTTPVEVPEQTQAKSSKFELVKEGAQLGAGMAAGISAVAGIIAGAGWLGSKIVKFAGGKIKAGKAKRAAKKAAKEEAEKAGKPSKKKAGEA